MAHKIGNRIKETASTSGTGSFTLAGAVSGFATFASKLTSNGDTTWYCAVNGSEWEVGYGTRTSSTVLARTTVLASSNSGSLVNFTTAPTVFCDMPAEKLDPGPAVRADRATTDQTITTGTWTKVQLNSETFDVGECFDSATNYRWTPDVPGYYQISLSVDIGAASALTSAISVVYKNGAANLYGAYMTSPSTTELITTGGGLVYMNGTTDYLELWALANATTPKVKFGPATYLTGHLARPAT